MVEKLLLERIRGFCRKARMSYSKFGAESINDPCLVTDLREGRELRAKTRKKVEKYIDAADPSEAN